MNYGALILQEFMILVNVAIGAYFHSTASVFNYAAAGFILGMTSFGINERYYD